MKFLQELSRRNVFKVATVYAVTSWLLIQVGSVVMPTFDAPTWIMKVFIVLLSFGFIIALILAWAFEITSEGVKRETEISPENSGLAHNGRTTYLLIIGVISLALVYFIYESQFNSQSVIANDAPSELKVFEVAIESEGTSIAVLPFVNMSSDPEQEYFSDGISEEILNVLAKIPDLHVTSRTSAFSYKNKDINIAEVAKVLGVKHVLEGSVRKSGTKVRITAQLIDASSDKHLWSETYDRELTDIFAVQDEISAAIVNALKTTLGIELVKNESTGKTINPDAYDLYLKGLRELHIATFDSLSSAVTAFESSIKIAPDFLLARIKLAQTFAAQVNAGSRLDYEILDTADDIIKQVLAIKPDSADAYYVRALIEASKINVAKGDWDRLAKQQYAKEAYRLNPNDANIVAFHAEVNGADVGEDKARALFKRAQQLDPLNGDVLANYASYLESLHAYGDAEIAYKQAIKINPNNIDYAFNLSVFYGQTMGNIIDAIKLMKIVYQLDLKNPDPSLDLSSYYLSLGDVKKAVEYADKAIALNPRNADGIDAKVDALIYMGQTDSALNLVNNSLKNADNVYRSWSKGLLISKAVYILLKGNEFTKAEALIKEHFTDIFSLSDAPLDAPLPESTYEAEGGLAIALLSTIYQVQGKTNKAQKFAERLGLLETFEEMFLSEDQARLSSSRYMLLAQTSTLYSSDKALTYLEAAIDNGYQSWGNWRTEISQSFYFISLHKQPRYIALIERLEAEMVRQRELLEND